MRPSLRDYARQLFEYWFRGGERPQLQLNPYEEFFLDSAVGGLAACFVYSILCRWIDAQSGIEGKRDALRYVCIVASMAGVLVNCVMRHMEHRAEKIETVSPEPEECEQTQQDDATEIEQCGKCQLETSDKLPSVKPAEENPAQRDSPEENFSKEAVPDQGLSAETSDVIVRNEESSLSSQTSEQVVDKSCVPKTQPESSDFKSGAQESRVDTRDSEHSQTVAPETKSDLPGNLATVSDVLSDQASKADFTTSAVLVVNVPPADGSEARAEVTEEPKTAETKPDLLKEVSTSEKAESSRTEETGV